MKPRDFLSERDFPLALALTYSFDPVFFERVVLPALWTGGSEDVHVLADGDEVSRALERVHGPIHQLGRRYTLSPVHTAGRFHPKLVLRFGRDEGRVWVSTGNLTHGGWGLNRELSTAWAFGPEHEDTGSWIRPLLAAARVWAPAPLAARSFDRIDDLSWLPMEASATPRVLVSGAGYAADAAALETRAPSADDEGPDQAGHARAGAVDPTVPRPVERTLGDQLLDRWRGRRFDRLRLLTGSTDSTGEALRFFADHFGVQEVTAGVTRSRCDWTPEGLSAQPFEINLHCLPAPVLHAKAYHLSGPDGDVLLVGSPNCTQAAWTRPPSRGGNTELLLVYEQPSSSDLAFFDVAFVGTPQSPTDALRDLPQAPTEAEQPAARYPLRIDRLEADEDGQLSVRIANLPPYTGPVELVLPGERIDLRLDKTGVWRGRAPDSLPPGQTAFGYVETILGTRRLRSGERWLDDLRLLQEAGSLRRLGTALSGLARPATPRDDDRLLQELTHLAHDLINDVQALRDPFRPRRQGDSGEARDVPVVDPDTLIRSLVDLPVPAAHPVDRDSASAATLGGIFRALFSDPEDEGGAEVGSDEEDASMDAEEGGVARATDPVGTLPPRRPSARAQDRFRRHLDQFVGQLQTERFREHCTARQLVQAVGYPFAATALGLKRGWTDVGLVRDWLTVVAGLLIHGRDGMPALLAATRDRYEEHRALEVFERIVGEGTLWTVVTVSLLGIPWSGPVQTLKRILLVRDLWNAQVLRATATPEHLAALARRYNAADAVHLMYDVAAPIGAHMGRLEQGLRLLCADGRLLTMQIPERGPIEAGELVWGPRNDWALTLESEVEGKIRVYWPKHGKDALMRTSGHFVSVRQATVHEASLWREYDQLVALFARLSTEL